MATDLADRSFLGDGIRQIFVARWKDRARALAMGIP
jgi:hypothetical protein